MLRCYLELLPRLDTGRQLAAIEASLIPHMKPEDAKRVMGRHKRILTPPAERKPAALALMDGFREAGWTIKHE